MYQGRREVPIALLRVCGGTLKELSLNLISAPTNFQRDPISGSGSKDVGIPQNLHRV